MTNSSKEKSEREVEKKKKGCQRASIEKNDISNPAWPGVSSLPTVEPKTQCPYVA
jgi:hypothetical protein